MTTKITELYNKLTENTKNDNGIKIPDAVDVLNDTINNVETQIQDIWEEACENGTMQHIIDLIADARNEGYYGIKLLCIDVDMLRHATPHKKACFYEMLKHKLEKEKHYRLDYETNGINAENINAITIIWNRVNAYVEQKYYLTVEKIIPTVK